jgi:hypothetical protein
MTAAPGYLSEAYARSLAEFGTPRLLPRSGGWVLERAIGECGLKDAMGPYPLFACRDWDALEADVEALAGELVSLTLVADPFGGADPERLRRAFPDRCYPFKEHFVAETEGADLARASKHHRYYARKALAAVELDLLEGDATAAFAAEWEELYGNLRRRHGLSGIKAFSPSAFEQQLRVPGALVLRAREAGVTVGAHIWYVQGEVAYSHLAAVSERGYALMAAYGLYAFALDVFRQRVRLVDWGAGAGTGADAGGLTRFKRGWATGTVPVHLCARILDPEAYARLSAQTPETAYFPMYRAGELS